jgi:hypothetical protein
MALSVGMVLLAAGCTTAGTPFAPSDRWNAGDSIAAAWPSYSSHGIYNAALDGNGFVTENIGTVESYTLYRLATEGSGTNLMFVTGGVNDRLYPLADRLAAMRHFETTLTGVGIKVIWVTEPTPRNAPDKNIWISQQPVNQWMLTRPFHADCAPVAEPFGTIDGLHPSTEGAQVYAACIDAAFP